MDQDFWRGKRVFITGHTGFKGSWLCRILVGMGAEITGYSIDVPTTPALFPLAGLAECMTDLQGDVRDFAALKRAFDAARPEIVFHLAAQPLVRESYKHPRETYETNVMGTVNLLECVRLAPFPVRSVVNVTTDKVYLNDERETGYCEHDPLDGFDPYSNSKSCSELVTHSYRSSFFAAGSVALSTARAGNVIGGGDFAADRILPDCLRAVMQGQAVVLRNPDSVRPYQHVLEPLFAYLMIAEAQYDDKSLSGWYNVGPDWEDRATTRELAALFCSAWGDGARYVCQGEQNAPHEAGLLQLDCSSLKKAFGWSPRWDVKKAVRMTCTWNRVWLAKGGIPAEMDAEIKEFTEDGYHV